MLESAELKSKGGLGFIISLTKISKAINGKDQNSHICVLIKYLRLSSITAFLANIVQGLYRTVYLLHYDMIQKLNTP